MKLSVTSCANIESAFKLLSTSLDCWRRIFRKGVHDGDSLIFLGDGCEERSLSSWYNADVYINEECFSGMMKIELVRNLDDTV